MTEYLSHDELFLLTGYTRSIGQATWLKERALPHRSDGRRVIVSRVHVQAWLEGKAVSFSSGPNWAAVK